MTPINTETDITDLLLDALDDAPLGTIDGGIEFAGRLASVQWLSATLGCSDSTTRNVIHHLRRCRMVRVFDVLDPEIGRRCLLVTGEAS